MWVIYKPNPHHVTGDQIDVVVNDPNNVGNTELKEEYSVQHTLNSAIKELFNRINSTEDTTGSIFNVLGTT